MNQNEFEQLCIRLKHSPQHLLSKEVFGILNPTRGNPSGPKFCRKKLPAIWIETNDSGDNNISFMNTTYPYLDQVFQNIIDLLYSNTFMAAQGQDALEILRRSALRYAGEFVLIVEGAIPVRDNGLYSIIAYAGYEPLTALKVVSWLGPLAKYVVTIGTCASFGGPSAARPNVAGNVPVSQVLNREVVKVSGCPVNPDWFVGTLVHLLLFGIPRLDGVGRPAMFYEFTVHRHCQRRSYFDRNDFAEKLGDIECMFSQGCVGPKTGSDCPYRLWVNHVSWPVKVNTPCIGCTNPDFPDGSAPFFTPMPQKSQRRNLV
ncbi:MAG TPA: hydrogenase small subunit [Firmicutes bacterium]|nr:hydrogenase small subunit [Bacillota bacterium]